MATATATGVATATAAAVRVVAAAARVVVAVAVTAEAAQIMDNKAKKELPLICVCCCFIKSDTRHAQIALGEGVSCAAVLRKTAPLATRASPGKAFGLPALNTHPDSILGASL